MSEKHSIPVQLAPVLKKKHKRQAKSDWGRIRSEWEAGARVKELVVIHKVSACTIHTYKREEKWVRDPSAVLTKVSRKCAPSSRWDAVQTDWEKTADSTAAVARRHCVAAPQLFNRIKRHGWKKKAA